MYIVYRIGVNPYTFRLGRVTKRMIGSPADPSTCLTTGSLFSDSSYLKLLRTPPHDILDTTHRCVEE